jgi:four helix bundle protein
MALASLCYEKTRSFPRTEAFGMTAQIRRAAASIPANIAEGNGREQTGSYIQSLRVSQRSLKELETHVLLAQTVELMNRADAEQILDMSEQVGKLLRALIRALQNREAD